MHLRENCFSVKLFFRIVGKIRVSVVLVYRRTIKYLMWEEVIHLV